MSSPTAPQSARSTQLPLLRIGLGSYLPEWLILAIAALTRFWRLDYHSFWFDEAVSLQWAGAGIAYTWEKTFALVEEKHPPAYYLTLHSWQRFLDLFGLAQQEVALRALGAFFGILTVLGVLLLASRLSGRRTALLAGLLVALSPALVWYSQELRMFQPAATAIIWGIYFLVRGSEGARVRGSEGANTQHELRITNYELHTAHWLGMIAALTYALYSYLFAAFALPGIGLSLLILCWRDGRLRLRLFVEGVTALAITAALFLPLARNAWLINNDQSPRGELFGGFFPYLWRQLHTFTIWQVDWPEPLIVATMLFFALLVGIGFVWPARQPSAVDERLLLLVWTLPPLVIAGIMQATNANVLKEDRYYLFLAPLVLWAAARGSVQLGERWRGLGWGSGSLAVALLILALPSLWTPRLYRENWRSAAEYIVAYQQQSESIPAAGVIHADYLYGILAWYLRPHYSFEQLPIYNNFAGPITQESLNAMIPALEGIEKSGAETLWLIQSHLEGVDDQQLLKAWLDARYPIITEQSPTGIGLIGYALRTRYAELPPLSPSALYPNVEVAPGLILAACEILTPEVAARDEIMHPPSGWVHVRLWWQATQPLPKDFQRMVRLIGSEGVWGEKLAREGELFRLSPPSTWASGGIVRDEVDINLNPATPGDRRYPVVVAVEDADGAISDQTASCGEVMVR
ncbi:MAG: glycosyltransferase family 39 protein [Caldilineaceae bacterium]|nr:glycosyltransferase family 39 protein [Caldilineaceae bacterium]